MNKEVLQQATEQKGGLAVGRMMWDIPASQIVSEFAANTQFRPQDAQMAYAYKQQLTSFIADQVAPFKPVRSMTGTYRKFNERIFFDRPATATGNDEAPGRVNYGSTMENFDLSGRALACYLSNTDKSQAELQYGSVQAWRNFAIQLMTYLLTLDRELAVRDLVQTAGNYAAGFTATANPLWSDPAADLIGDMATADDTLFTTADTYIISQPVFRLLQKHPAITGSSTATALNINLSNPRVGIEFLRSYFGQSNILVSNAKYNTTPHNDTLTLDYIWGDEVVICRAQEMPGGAAMNIPFVTTLVLEGEAIPNYRGWGVKSVMENSSFAGGELLMCGYWSQEKVYAQKSGYLLTVL